MGAAVVTVESIPVVPISSMGFREFAKQMQTTTQGTHALYLTLTREEIYEVRKKYCDDHEQKYQMLLKWQQKVGHHAATWRKLADTCQNWNGYEHLVSKIHHLCKCGTHSSI